MPDRCLCMPGAFSRSRRSQQHVVCDLHVFEKRGLPCSSHVARIDCAGLGQNAKGCQSSRPPAPRQTSCPGGCRPRAVRHWDDRLLAALTCRLQLHCPSCIAEWCRPGCAGGPGTGGRVRGVSDDRAGWHLGSLVGRHLGSLHQLICRPGCCSSGRRAVFLLDPTPLCSWVGESYT